MRPKIICHMVSSVDGRLLAARWTPLAAGIDNGLTHQHYEQIAARFEADGWMVGRKTMQSYAEASIDRPDAIPAGARAPHVADRTGRKVAVALDPRGKLHYGTDAVDGDHIVAVLGTVVPDDYLTELRDCGVSYLFAGADGTDLAGAMAILGDMFGVRTLLLEGGGRINGAFLAAGLIDEISIIICPAIDGLAGIASIFHHVGAALQRPAAGQSLRHLATEVLEGGFVWLRYTIEPAPAGSDHDPATP